MDFLSYARACGILIDRLPPPGRWVRYPTTDKPNKKNGAVKWMGEYGHVQNFATMPECDTWHADGNDSTPAIDHAEVARVIALQREQRLADQAKAAKLAGWVLHQCVPSVHPYLASKGFPLEQGNVWRRERDGERKDLLVVPMRVDGHLVGCQLIAPDGDKRFLKGQRTDGAVFSIDNKGGPVLVEGYAKALAVRAALQAIRMRYKLLVCFSAGNMARIAADLPDAFIVADRDEPSQHAPEAGGMGLKVAKESGRRYWISDKVGQDFDRYLRDVGVFKASQALREAMKRP